MTRPAIGMEYTVLDCPDPGALAAFYGAVLGWEVTRSDDHWVVLQGQGALRLAFQLAPDFVPVDWPARGVRVHLDLRIDDMDASTRWVLGLGAELVEGPADHPDFAVFRDPAGHLFCLCLND
ncbi:VOC family protein [Rhodococcus sp. MTM3W5.2]|uniref:VOC family protein n=1 Tax=Rhodococcus sp. MTM3W5.2 TaxID=1805827 RepID=UPI00097C00C1|nr:VOC family protein [Rhodococcus sp. MTM3W5.2]